MIVLALSFAPVLRQFTTDARAPTSDTAVGLDCANETINDYDKSTCVLVDLSIPYFIIGLIAIAFVIIGAKMSGGN